MPTKTGDQYLGFRLPPEVKKWLQQQAKRENRTMSNYMVLLMDELKHKVGDKSLTEFLNDMEV